MASKKQAKSQEQIVAGFQELRQQQRGVASKISELEMDMKEHEYILFCRNISIDILLQRKHAIFKKELFPWHT